jgi:hypothetical protein
MRHAGPPGQGFQVGQSTEHPHTGAAVVSWMAGTRVRVLEMEKRNPARVSPGFFLICLGAGPSKEI